MVCDRTPGLYFALTMYHHTEGRLGPAVRQEAAPLVHALGLIDSGRAWREAEARKSKT